MVGLGFGTDLSIKPLSRRAAAFADLGASLLGLFDAEKQVATSGSAVTGWTDPIANLTLAQATGANQPAMTTLNGRAAVAFDGTTDFLSADSVPYPTGAAPSEIWLLASVTLDAVLRRFFQYGASSGAASRAILRSTTGEIAASAGDGSTQSQAIQATTAGVHIYRARFEANQISISQDGGALVTVSGLGTMATGTTRVRMGATTNNTPNNFALGSIALAGIFAPLSDTQAALVLSLFRARGNIA